MTLRILAAASGFEGDPGVAKALKAVAAGVTRARPEALVRLLPFVERGAGLAEALVEATGGTLRPVGVTGPYGDPVESRFGLLGGAGPRTLVIDAAAAAGFHLVAPDKRDPIRASSYGVGELLRLGLSAGAERLLVAFGSTLLCDAGVGMAQALGVRFLDDDGSEVRPGALELSRIRTIDASKRDPRLKEVRIDAAVDRRSVLLGAQGVARSKAPAKGATPGQVPLLEEALAIYADRLRAAGGQDVGLIGGGGGAGGMGATLVALFGGRLVPRFDLVMDYLRVEEALAAADLVLLAQGAAEREAPESEGLGKLARKAKLRGLPVAVLAPKVGEGFDGDHDFAVAYPTDAGGRLDAETLICAAEEVTIRSQRAQ